MGFLLLLEFAVKCFDILAWPLLSLGYPLCASIRAIEADSNSDIRKLVTYWVLFSLISLFDHAFARLLEWLSFWPYVQLMVIFLLVVPHFYGSLYVYENLVRPCFSVNPPVVTEICNKRKEKLFLERENFLVAAEMYLKENGPEALEKLISSKCKEPNVDEKEIKAVAASEKKEVRPLNCKEPNIAQKGIKSVDPNIAQKEIKSVEATETKDEAAAKLLKCKEPNIAQKEIKVVEITDKKELATEKRVNQTVLNLPQTENQTFTASGTKATTAATAGSDSKLPEIPASMKVQKEWACALCQVTTQSETTLLSHLQGQRHKAACEELKAEARKCAASNGLNQKNTGNGSNQKNSGSTDKKSNRPKADAKNCAVSNGSNKKNTGKRVEKVEELGKQKIPNKTGVGIEQFCNICNVRCHSEVEMNSHLNGKRHLAQIQELIGNAGWINDGWTHRTNDGWTMPTNDGWTMPTNDGWDQWGGPIEPMGWTHRTNAGWTMLGGTNGVDPSNQWGGPIGPMMGGTNTGWNRCGGGSSDGWM